MSSPLVPTIIPILLIVISIISSLCLVQSAQTSSNQSGTNKPLKHGDEEMESPVGPPLRRYSGSKSQSSPFTPSKGSYYYPISDPYYDDYYERPGRQLSARSVSASYPVIAAAASNQVGFDSEFAASGHGGGHGHGWGWGGGGGGWGWSGGHGSNSIDNSLGLLGLLGLLSLLSNVLMLITTTAAPSGTGRRKRDTNPFDDLQLAHETRVGQLCHKILPSLNVIGHVQDKRIPVNCSHQEICTTNKIIVNEFGTQGQAAGSMLSAAILKMLRQVDKSPFLEKHLIQAGEDGREGKACEKIYPTCKSLLKGKQDLPQLLSPQHVNGIFLKRNPNLVPASG